MHARPFLALASAAMALAAIASTTSAPACCPTPPPGKSVVNADQTIIMIWDANAKMQHFIRQASFRSEAEDFGFLVPTPTQPELNESGNETFPYLQELTAPEIETRKRSGNMGCGCGGATREFAGVKHEEAKQAVRVLEEKLVAGFKAVVLEADSANALTGWLKENGYTYSPEIEAWAKPYVDGGWKITALKVVKEKDDAIKKTVATSALRLSFKTDRPIFPYREPDYTSVAQKLNAKHRLLRIYFIAEGRYQGDLTKETPWTGQVAWANPLKPEQRSKVLELLKLPEQTGPTTWWLTEFEDNWLYKVAPEDVYFTHSPNQGTVKRPPIIQYVASPWPTDVMTYAVAALLMTPIVFRRFRGRQ
jgi:Uncharacterized protein conserved in bacteria (DUF2330)